MKAASMRRWWRWRGIAAACLLAAGCAEDLKPEGGEPGGQASGKIQNTDNGDGTTTTRVDAQAEDAWVYFDLGTRSEVSPADPAGSPDWDLAFRRFQITSNGGVSGTGGVEVAVLPGADFTTLATAPNGGYVSDAADSDDEGEDLDTPFLAGDGWYQYDPSDHTLSPREVVFVIKSVEGDTFKLEMLGYYDDAGTSGFPTFRWGPVVAPSGPPDPAPEGLVVDASASGTWVYVDLDSAQVVDVADPAASDAWDVGFSRTQVRTNSGTSGARLGGARLGPEGVGYAGVATSPTIGFAEDELVPLPGPPGSGEFSGNPVLNAWYDYDPATHDVSPKDAVFLVRTAGGDHAKLQVAAYAGGVFTLRTDAVERDVTVETSVVDASAADAWVHMNLRLGRIVTIDDPSTSVAWDVALSRTMVRTNSGTSGSGEGGAVDAGAASLDEVTAAPTGQGCYQPAAGHICSCEMTEPDCGGVNGIWTDACECEAPFVVDEMLPLPGPPGSGEFSGNPVLNGWYDYDPATHATTPKDRAFVVRTADGGYAKLKFTDYADGSVTLQWAYAGAGRSDL